MADAPKATASKPVNVPRVAITFCTQCRWMLRAAYFGQELLSTFGTSIGEVALIPATGGLFQVHLTYKPVATEDSDDVEVKEVLIWDRKTEGGFPESKVLKQKVRDCIEPSKGLGHSDVGGKKGNAAVAEKADVGGATAAPGGVAPGNNAPKTQDDKKDCDDCK